MVYIKNKIAFFHEEEGELNSKFAANVLAKGIIDDLRIKLDSISANKELSLIFEGEIVLKEENTYVISQLKIVSAGNLDKATNMLVNNYKKILVEGFKATFTVNHN